MQFYYLVKMSDSNNRNLSASYTLLSYLNAQGRGLGKSRTQLKSLTQLTDSVELDILYMYTICILPVKPKGLQKKCMCH